MLVHIHGYSAVVKQQVGGRYVQVVQMRKKKEAGHHSQIDVHIIQQH
jgi:hypothetical protein